MCKTGAYNRELLIFINWNFKRNLEHKILGLVMGSNIILRKIYVQVD